MILPAEAHPLLFALCPAFTYPTFDRFATLIAAAVLTPGRRAVANLLRTLGPLAHGHPTTYQRVLSCASWSGLCLGLLLARFLLHHLLAADPAVLVGDDTVDGHTGKHVYGKARRRDPVRSTKSYTAWRYGHKWVVPAVLVRLPFATRPRALPVLVDLYRCAEDDRRQKRPHRTPARLTCRLLRLLLLRFPGRRFVFVGDSGYGSREVARFCRRRHPRLTLVSKLCPDANLAEPPPPYAGAGRPRVQGAALPKPRQAAAAARRRRATVAWYGGGTRRVEVVTGTGRWYRSGRGLVPPCWVFVRDRSGTHRDEYLYSTDPALLPEAVVGYYTCRWNVETTFAELRSCLGLESTRGWCARTVPRAAPCLSGLYTVVALLYRALPGSKRSGAVRWPGKSGVTFSDARAAVRRWLWTEWVLPRAGAGTALVKLPGPLHEILLAALAPA